MHTLLGYIESVLELELPFLGICLGLQALCKVKGGVIDCMKTKEIGFRDQQGE